MSVHNTLLLGSKSLQRRQALLLAKIPFILVEQDADESLCDYGLPFPKLLEAIAVHKMNHVLIPPEWQCNKKAFVLTVDTMIQDGSGTIYGKPGSKKEALRYIQTLRNNPGVVGTAFCLDKKIYDAHGWHTAQRIIKFVRAEYQLDIPDHWIESYLENYPDYLQIAGALTIESYGAQFVKSLNGSYGAALGLPIFELREALDSLEFFLY